MSLDPSLRMKWITLETAPPTLDTILTECGVLYSRSAAQIIDGFTAFSADDFSGLGADFIDRLDRRMMQPENIGKSFYLVLPPTLRAVSSMLLRSAPRPRLRVSYSPFLSIRNWGSQFFIRERLRIVNVDDSAVILKILANCCAELGYVDVLAQVNEPREAVETIMKFRPDVVTMDIQMPGMTGIEVVKNLLAVKHFRVVVVSSLSLEEGSQVFEALNAGAFDYLQKPQAENRAQFTGELGDKLLTAAEARPRISSPKRKSPQGRTPSEKYTAAVTASLTTRPVPSTRNLLWCLGASTGGTQALTEIMTALPATIPPTLIVQHIPPVFSKAFATSLNQLCPFTVKEAQTGDILQDNHVYVAAGGFQMGFESQGSQIRIVLRDEPPVNRFKPSIDYMFREIARLEGYCVVAGLLTGMGRDGAQGLLNLREKGASTFAQDEASSAVYGMPRAAVEIFAADRVVALDDIAPHLLSQSRRVSRAG